jgi:16S rRNA (guanine527-N7)-methyltransferase
VSKRPHNPDELPVLLEQGLAALELTLDVATVKRLLDYLDLLSKWNAVYNLTAIRNPREMLVQHLLDSLAVIPLLRRHLDLDHALIADVGSGAGLPGLPIAMVCPVSRILSIEPVGKKAAFQRQVCAELALTNVEIFADRVENLSRPVDLVVCRAFASLPDFLGASSGLIGPRTRVAALKGQLAEISQERAELPQGWEVSVLPLTVPLMSASRHLVLMHRQSTVTPS